MLGGIRLKISMTAPGLCGSSHGDKISDMILNLLPYVRRYIQTTKPITQAKEYVQSYNDDKNADKK